MQLIHRISVFLSLIIYISIQALLFDDDGATDDNSLLTAQLRVKELNKFYAAVIDAGSTGTRLHLYEFMRGDAQRFKLQRDFFREVKPGLSSFAQSPEDAADSVQELLDAARSVLPEALLNRTPIALKATAGLRLLPGRQAENILKSVERRVALSGFQMDDNAVAMLSGTDEGVFSWFALNVLVDRIKYIVDGNRECDISHPEKVTEENNQVSAAALDLGGGSTQITFKPSDPEAAFTGVDEKKYSHEINVFGKMVRLYTHSYLGNGLIAARVGITRGSSASVNGSFLSECFPDGYSLDLRDTAGGQWKIEGSAPSFKGCLRAARQYIRKTGVVKVPELEDQDVYAFSYFYDRGLEAELAPQTPDDRGGFTTVVDYKKAARQACIRSQDVMGIESWNPWHCLDLTYIYVLLHDGYGLKNSKKLYLAKRFRDTELSWTLGAGYDLLHSYGGNSISPAEDFMNESSSTSEDETLNRLAVDVFSFVVQGASSLLSFFNIIS